MASVSQAFYGFMTWFAARAGAVPLPFGWAAMEYFEDDEEPPTAIPAVPRVQFERGPRENTGPFVSVQIVAVRLTCPAVTLPDGRYVPAAQALSRVLDGLDGFLHTDELIPAYKVGLDGSLEGRGCFAARYVAESGELALDTATSQRVLTFELTVTGKG